MRELLRRIGLRGRPVKPAPEPVSEPAPQEIIASIGEPFVSVLCSMYRGEPQMGSDGQTHPIETSTSIAPKHGMLIYQLVRDTRPENTLEIGLAFGF